MVQPSCGFRDSSPAEFWMMSCWSFSLQGCHCWDLRGKSICPLPLKTYIRLCKVVKRSGFFVSLVIQVIPGIIHWMKNSLKLYLHNSRRILGVSGGFFWRRMKQLSLPLYWRAQPLGRLLWSHTALFALLLGLGKWCCEWLFRFVSPLEF